jgi:MFS family permease
MLTSGIVVNLLMTPTLLQRSFGLPARTIQWANFAACAIGPVSTALVGAATDRFGIRRVAVPAVLLMSGAMYALYIGVERTPEFAAPIHARRYRHWGRGACADHNDPGVPAADPLQRRICFL